jgi:hypothetical protein
VSQLGSKPVEIAVPIISNPISMSLAVMHKIVPRSSDATFGLARVERARSRSMLLNVMDWLGKDVIF